MILYIHGKDGSYLEAGQYRKNCLGFDMIGIDYDDDVPWIVQDQIRMVYDNACERYGHIYVIADSIGAYFAMHTLQDCDIEKALSISPVLDMERLILDMMGWADASFPAESMYLERGYQITSYEKIKTENGDFLCYHTMEKAMDTGGGTCRN